ncbi:HNH endonuclease signature motif containing protein [Yersinia enterocolitica]
MITQPELKHFLHYEPETGLFTWLKKNSNRVKVGDVAGSVSDNGYIHIRLNRHLHKAHRLAWLYVHGKWPRNVIDHINTIRADNRICNQRDVTRTINSSNLSEIFSSASGYTGVTWCKGTEKWRVKIQFNGKHYHIGRYKNIDEAVEAYKKAKDIAIKQKIDFVMNGDQVREQVYTKRAA